jgi:demethylmenaquinone methyltransferase/2-methoxy-6-polyprenyl-1,4-benzoquinol methylase
MAHLTGDPRAQYVQGMFTRIAWRYDLMNRLMTFGQDYFWRREVIRRAGLPPQGGRLLDLGAGTGDLGRQALRRHPDTLAVEADFTLEMMRAGQARQAAREAMSALSWSAADALNLPFPGDSFDAVVSGFLLRNVIDLPRALAEQYRILKPGGRLVCLDTTQPQKNLLTPLVRFHMHHVIPWLGRLVSGQGDAYEYLPATSEAFLSAEALAGHLTAAGFQGVAFRRLNFGTVAIHWGTK